MAKTLIMKRLIISLILFAAGPIHSLEKTKKILFLGDSLTAGYGVEKSKAYPFLFQQLLNKEKDDVQVINAAESGSLSSSTLTKLNFYRQKQKMKFAMIVIATGGNDARQGTAPLQIEKFIEKTIIEAKKSKAKIVLAGMQIFSNYGKNYVKQYKDIYPRLAKKHQLIFIKFLLEGVAGIPKYNQKDGFHPNDIGHQRIARQVYLKLKDHL